MRTHPSQKTISQLYKYRANLDLEPPFQRQKVWSEKKQQYFIDTVIRGWGIPKMYFLRLSKKNAPTNLYACIDGKQRMTSIYNFLEGNLTLNKEFTSSYAGKKYADLPEKVQNLFDDYKINIEEATDATDDEISELFKRLQGGVSLNSGEKLMANGGDLCGVIKSFAQLPFFAKKILLSDTRYTYFTICTQLTYLENHGISNLSYSQLENFIKNGQDLKSAGFELKSKLKKVQEVLDKLNIIFDVPPSYFKNRASIVSAYLLISDLIEAGNIDTKHKQIKLFFDKFMKELDNELKKGSKATNAQLINYQSAVTQGADKQKSIHTRQEILKERLIKFDPSFHSYFNKHKDPVIKLNNLYDQFEIKLGKSSEVDNWIFSQKPRLKKIKCPSSKKPESLPTHVRHSFHHSKHGKFDVADIRSSIKILEDLIDKLPK